MGNIIGFILIPLLLYVAVPVGIVAIGFTINKNMLPSPVRRRCRIGIGLTTLYLAGLWIWDVQHIVDWLWFMAFGGGWAGR